MAIDRNQRTVPLTLKSTTNYALNQGIVAAFDYAGDPANSYAGGNGAPHVGNVTLGHAGLPTVVSLDSGKILARDPSQGKTVITPYTGLSVGPLGFGAADGKGSFTIHRRYRAPTAYSGTSANRGIAVYRDNQSRVSIFMVESIANPWCYFFVEMGATTASMPPSGTRDSSAAFRIPYGSVVDLHIVREGDSARFYLNGALISTISIPSFLLYNTAWGGIATNDGIDGGNPNDLLLIDQTIWNRALSNGEVSQHKADPYAGYLNSAVVADGITIISPVTGTAVNSEGFTVSGTYQGGSPASIEARFNGGSWNTIVSSPTGGSYSGMHPAVTRATGVLEVRYGNNTAVTATAANITASPPVPTVSVTGQPAPDGQSVAITVSCQRADSVTFNLVANGNGAVSVTDTTATAYSTSSATVSKTFTGVAPGDYTVNVVATGPSAQTTASGTGFSILGVSGGGSVDTPATAATVPGAPTNVNATASETGAVVLFNPPVSDGGSAVTNYVVTASTGQVVNTLSSPAIFILPRGVSVNFTVKAVNDIGPSAASATSNSVIPASVPGAPTGVVASVSGSAVSIAFVFPADNGGYPITRCRVEASTGEVAEGTQSPIVIDVPITSPATFTAKVQNAIGYGPASVPSNSVLPKAMTVALPMTAPVGSTVANLSELKWAWFDQSTPDSFTAPTDKGTIASTTGAGVLTLNIPNTTLRSGQIGWLIITNSDGTVGTTHQAFSGPVEAT